MKRAGPLVLSLPVIVFLASPVSARDLPRREPPHKATGCEGMGEGFVKVEGTDTCVRVGGSVRAEFSATGGGGLTPPSDR